ncbi:hypothetical protein [Caulobacter endophyticus]|uniref:hypothetical protein n=1 Tax=Caulobacter endophyticus TaxID=2172652 RepID=UPI002410A4EF|nr:hypothetical protein [Caulobacter endophyticus]MDG2531434.1 hypothetical protein [Caulobacter endophyticus]
MVIVLAWGVVEVRLVTSIPTLYIGAVWSTLSLSSVLAVAAFSLCIPALARMVWRRRWIAALLPAALMAAMWFALGLTSAWGVLLEMGHAAGVRREAAFAYADALAIALFVVATVVGAGLLAWPRPDHPPVLGSQV